MRSNSAGPGGSLTSKPTWPNTFGCTTMSAFFFLTARGVSVHRAGVCERSRKKPKIKDLPFMPSFDQPAKRQTAVVAASTEPPQRLPTYATLDTSQPCGETCQQPNGGVMTMKILLVSPTTPET